MVKSILSLLLTGLFVISGSAQTVVIDFGPISGAPGETVLVPVELTGVEATSGFNSFSFSVNVTGANLTYNEDQNIRTGTLSAASGWTVLSLNGKVGGFASSQNTIETSGTLINLSVTITAEGAAAVELVDFTLTRTNSQGGTDQVAFSPPVPSAALSVSNAPEAVDDTFQVDEGGTLTVTAANGVLSNDTDADGDPLAASVATGPSNGTLTLNADGSFVYTHDGSETTSDSFTYTVSDGNDTDIGSVAVTVVPVNDAPVFTQSMTDTTVDVGELVVGQFAASDEDNATLTFLLVSGPPGASINPLTGEFSWSASQAGVFTVQVSVSDGTEVVEAPRFTITAQVVETHTGELLGFHQPAALPVSGFGEIEARFSESDNSLVIAGTYEGLESSIAFAQVGIGALGEEGTGVLVLTETETDNSSGAFEASGNSFDLDTDLSAGITALEFIDAYRAGNVFVNVRTVGRVDGELRAQLLPEANLPPSVLDVTVPFSADVTGDPGAPLLDATWSGDPADADGDVVRLLLLAAADDQFEDVLSVYDVTALAGDVVNVTVAEAAGFVDEIVGAPQPGAAATVYWVLLSTDGSSANVGQVSSTVLTRGAVTDTELDESVPGQFLLRGTYPNPFVDRTRIEFDLPEAADVEVRVMDMLGRTMLTVPARSMPAGTDQHVEVSASELSSGIYLYQVIASGATGTRTATGTMTLLK